MAEAKENSVCVTLGWDFKPTIALPDNMVYPRFVEEVLHKQYYVNSHDGWPRDPETGEKLPMVERSVDEPKPVRGFLSKLKWFFSGFPWN